MVLACVMVLAVHPFYGIIPCHGVNLCYDVSRDLCYGIIFASLPQKITHYQSANTQNLTLKSQVISQFSSFDTIPFHKLNSEIFTNVIHIGSRLLFFNTITV